MAEREGNACARAQVVMLRSACAWLAVALGVTVLLVELGTGWPWRLAVGLFFFASFLELYQSFSATCVIRAAMGARITSQGTEKIANPAELARVRRRARGVLGMAMASSSAATALVLVLA